MKKRRHAMRRGWELETEPPSLMVINMPDSIYKILLDLEAVTRRKKQDIVLDCVRKHLKAMQDKATHRLASEIVGSID